MRPSRRGLLLGAGTAGLAPFATAGEVRLDDAWHQTILERYAAFGDKSTGGPGDMATGAWLEDELTRLGFHCHRHAFVSPFFDADQATLTIEGHTASVIPQAPVTPTDSEGVRAPLALSWGSGRLDGRIALIVLPSRRWSSALDGLIQTRLNDVWARGAIGAVLITTGPTGDALALNAPARLPPGPGPIAVLAPNESDPFLDAAAEGRTGRLVLSGTAGQRPAFNLTARLARGASQAVVLSTPRSGWFTCAAERGSGIAVWLAAAHWLARRQDPFDVELVAISGHEYENLGGEHYLEALAPKPERTRLWVHVGANLAARDWHTYGRELRPLPGPDAQRYLLASPDVADSFARAYAGQAGLEAVYPATVENSAGELTNILRAGYPSAAGFFGNHKFHHSRKDDLRCVTGALVRPASEALRRALAEILAS